MMGVVSGLVLIFGACCALQWRWFHQRLIVQRHGASR